MTQDDAMFDDAVAPAEETEGTTNSKGRPPKKRAARNRKPAERATDQRAAPRQGGSRPARVADDDIASAEYLQVNQECPFTDGCNGRLRANIFVAPTPDQPGGVKQMQLYCPRCRVATKDTRVVGGAKLGAQKLFDRRKGE